MLADVRFGFGEHGHLSGRPCLIGVVDDGTTTCRVDMLTLPSRMPGLPMLLMVMPRSMDEQRAEALVHLYRDLTALGRTVYTCVRPLVPLRDAKLAHTSILRVLDADDFGFPPDCDDRYLSVSVHCWPGSHVMERLSRIPADQGRYLFVDGEEFGAAKVWLGSEDPSAAAWTLQKPHDMNDNLEPAELDEMLVRGR